MLFPTWNFTAEGGRFSSTAAETHSTGREFQQLQACSHNTFPKLLLLDLMCSICRSCQQTFPQIQLLQQDFQNSFALVGNFVSIIFLLTLSNSSKASRE